MKHLPNYLVATLFLIIALIFQSCDKEYSVEYKILNSGIEPIEVKIGNSSLGTFQDSFIIEANEFQIIDSYSGLGANTNEYLQEATRIPFDTILILNHLEWRYSNDPLDIRFWHRYVEINDQAPGIFELEVLPNEFIL